MDMEQIRSIVEAGLPANATYIERLKFSQMSRQYEELVQLQEQIQNESVNEKAVKDAQSEKNKQEELLKTRQNTLRNLKEENEKYILEKNKQVESLNRETKAQASQIEALEGECNSIRNEINDFSRKPEALERLRRKQQDLQRKTNDIQVQLDALGEEFNQQDNYYKRLEDFVNKIEGLETDMSNVMSKIWDDLKGDAFDRMN